MSIPSPLPNAHLNTFSDGLSIFTATVEKTRGRDKVYKTVQYTLKLALLYGSLSTSTEKRIKSLVKTISLSRNMYTITNGLVEGRAALAAGRRIVGCLRGTRDRAELSDDFLDLGSELFACINDTADDIYLLNQVSAGEVTPAWELFSTWSSRCWALGTAFDILMGTQTILSLQERRRVLAKSRDTASNATADLQKVEARLNSAMWSQAKYLCDFIAAVNSGWEDYVQFPPTVLAVLGLISALIGTKKVVASVT